MPNPERYEGPVTFIWDYQHEYMVRCPRCEGPALVSCPKVSFKPVDPDKERVLCLKCGFSRLANDVIRYNIRVKRACSHCDHWFDVCIPNNKEKAAKIRLSCDGCGAVEDLVPENEAYRDLYTDERLSDPLFGLPLYYQAPIRNDVLWAFNKKHLSDIRDYVASRLRERQTMQWTTMVEKLPHFIKDAKNRDQILKVIDRMLEIDAYN